MQCSCAPYTLSLRNHMFHRHPCSRYISSDFVSLHLQYALTHTCPLVPNTQIGQLVARDGWYNAGYIFPAGFKSRLLFRSSVDLDAICYHECEIIGEGGQYWPGPTYRVVAADRPDEPLIARSCTGCWTGVRAGQLGKLV